jgi:glycosyltransferase involved in cell wall biosynthesis
MRVVQISTEDLNGGAARACYRLLQGLRRIGVDASMVVRHKSSGEASVVEVRPETDPGSMRSLLSDRAIQECYLDPRRRPDAAPFSSTHAGFDLRGVRQVADAEVLHLHWISFFQSMVGVQQLAASGRPVVWTLHDMRPFTGGCHYAGSCHGYRHTCTACPQLADDPAGLVPAELNEAASVLSALGITLVTPSRWLAGLARESAVFSRARIEVIPNAIDTDLYEPGRRAAGRQRLGVDDDAVVVLFGAASIDDPRKGAVEMLEALRLAVGHPRVAPLVDRGRLHLVRFGQRGAPIEGLPTPVVDIDYSDDETSLAELYAAADLFVLPSRDDNLPNTMIESLSCGTPVVAFATGGIPDAVRDGDTGWLAPPMDVRRLAEALEDAIVHPDKRVDRGGRGRAAAVSEYGLAIQAERCLALYTDLLAGRGLTTGGASSTPAANAPEAHVAPTVPLAAEVPAVDGGPRAHALAEAMPEYARRLSAALQESDADRQSRLTQVETLDRLLREADSDREARLTQIHELGDLLGEATLDCEARLTQIHQLGDLLREATLDREARLTQIHQLGDLLREANADREARLTQIHQLGALLHTATEDAAARLAHMHTFEQLLAATTRQAEETRFELEQIRAEQSLAHVAARADRHDAARRPLVAIDVTPILPGSENGGAKGLVLALLEGFAQARRHRYLLLTSDHNHDSFAAFETPDMTLARRLFERGRRIAGLGPLAQHGVDLLLCPMTDPQHAEPGVPTVSVIYDLQHLAYPDFFSAAERGHRDGFFSRVRQTADAIVCISEFTRREVIARLGIDEARVSAIPIAVHARLPLPPAEQVQAVRERYGLEDAPFLLFPANGWPHKNHRVLLVAFARVVRERPDLRVRLVLAGNLLGMSQELSEAVETMGLADRVRLVGFVPDADLAALWRGAACLVFPTLYEGFGIPLVEAMRFGTPIISSDAASLPEVGGDAARYVDPRRPGDIAAAIIEMLEHPTLHHELTVRGAQRLSRFDTGAMVRSYLDVIDRALAVKGHVQVARVEGLFADRWLGPSTTALSGPSSKGRSWTFDMQFPEWLPHRRATIHIDLNGRAVRRLVVVRGQTTQVVVKVPPHGGYVRLRIHPSFVPGTNGDQRELTAVLVKAELSESSGEVVHVI